MRPTLLVTLTLLAACNADSTSPKPLPVGAEAQTGGSSEYTTGATPSGDTTSGTETGGATATEGDSTSSGCTDDDPQLAIYLPCRGCILELDDTQPLPVSWNGSERQIATSVINWVVHSENDRWARRVQILIGTEALVDLTFEHGTFSGTGGDDCEHYTTDTVAFLSDRIEDLTAGNFSTIFSVWPENTDEADAFTLVVAPAGVVVSSR